MGSLHSQPSHEPVLRSGQPHAPHSTSTYVTSSMSAALNETTLQPFRTDAAVYFGVVVVAICLLPAAFFFSCRVGRRFRLSRHHRHVATTVATTPEDSQSSSAPDRVLAIRLDHAEAARKSLRVRVSATFWQMGWTILVLGLAPLTYEIFTVDVRAPIVGHFFYYASAMPWGTALIVLTLRPTDATHIRYACLFFSGACAIFGPLIGFMAAAGSHYGFNPIHRVALLILFLLAVLGVVLLWPNLDVCRCSAQPKSPRSKLLRLWLTGRLLFGGGAICFFIQFLAPFYDGQFTAPTGGVDDAQSARLVMSAACLAVTVMCTPANRGRVVRWLSALQERNIILGAGDSSMQEAAAVAALLGDQTVGNALAYALKGFRALPLAVLTPEDLREKEPTAAKHGQRVRWEERSQEAEELRMLSDAARAQRCRAPTHPRPEAAAGGAHPSHRRGHQLYAASTAGRLVARVTPRLEPLPAALGLRPLPRLLRRAAERGRGAAAARTPAEQWAEQRAEQRAGVGQARGDGG